MVTNIRGRRTRPCSSVALLDDRRIVGGNERRHFVGTYGMAGGRLYFHGHVSFHGSEPDAEDDEDRIPYEIEGVGEISADGSEIQYVAHIVGRRGQILHGTLRRIAEVPNFRKLS